MTAPVLAQDGTGAAPHTETPAMKPNDMDQMMQGGGDNMMGMMNMMTQMNDMMSACTKMMLAVAPEEEKSDAQKIPG